jgi:hypothetical protein
MAKQNDFTGMRFGRLIALEDSKVRIGKAVLWRCRCDCGNEKLVMMNDLKRGYTKSCGCLNSELARERRFKHGLGRTKLYRLWRGIKTRCLNPNDKSYKYYGGKGIGICANWKSDFKEFMVWALSSGYTEGLSIDRINPKGDYEPSNCQWLTVSENILKRWHGENCVQHSAYRI